MQTAANSGGTCLHVRDHPRVMNVRVKLRVGAEVLARAGPEKASVKACPC